jgi:hypothetical protein
MRIKTSSFILLMAFVLSFLSAIQAQVTIPSLAKTWRSMEQATSTLWITLAESAK